MTSTYPPNNEVEPLDTNTPFPSDQPSQDGSLAPLDHEWKDNIFTRNRKLIIAIGSLTGLVLILLIIGIFRWWKRSKPVVVQQRKQSQFQAKPPQGQIRKQQQAAVGVAGAVAPIQQSQRTLQGLPPTTAPPPITTTPIITTPPLVAQAKTQSLYTKTVVQSIPLQKIPPTPLHQKQQARMFTPFPVIDVSKIPILIPSGFSSQSKKKSSSQTTTSQSIP